MEPLGRVVDYCVLTLNDEARNDRLPVSCDRPGRPFVLRGVAVLEKVLVARFSISDFTRRFPEMCTEAL